MSQLFSFFDPEPAAFLEARRDEALKPGRHGDLPKWQAAIDALPEVETGWHIEDGILVAGKPAKDPEALAETLRQLIPWRKGPLNLGGVGIDTEWRSDWKWNHIAPHVNLNGQRVLDIGAGNGYFGWRMLADGAAQVVGCDPTLLFYTQYQAIEHFAGQSAHLLLPLKFEQLPARADFDSVFSMGVLYHRKNPHEHLQRIRDHLIPNGTAFIETLIIPGRGDDELDPKDRYANMRNVHHLPTEGRLLRWMKEAGFSGVEIVDVTPTTVEEQRSTDWMPFHSLVNALAEKGGLTIEGFPPPLRATVVGR
ncbi:MAG TPA: tRNA 5-methoxyuridine(34)/uridine 5-oxyacetic acid(34) synthase CmoB [Opitutales bacterium]|nr:tRNA 5-methoxyuridine(34)/uridine 5-oxyacetic acid(34) synthase CmoB [Opitutales bacterium]